MERVCICILYQTLPRVLVLYRPSNVLSELFVSHGWLTASLLGCFFFLLGFKLKDFLQDSETLSHFLHHNASLPRHALKQIVEADVNLEKVELYPSIINPALTSFHEDVDHDARSLFVRSFSHERIALAWPQCEGRNPMTLAWPHDSSVAQLCP